MQTPARNVAKEEYQMAFQEAYTRLNSAQKAAVDAVEGPVLVIAGPGTGKTHILTMRVANILQKTTDTSPENILVLTFTDSAARTVKKRVAQYIGEEAARRLQVFTFHSFANYVLKEFPAAFAEYADSRQMSEIETILLWRQVLEREEVEYLRTPKSPFFYLRDLMALEDDMTRERLSLEDFSAWIAEEEQRILADESLRYKRGGKGGAAGELNADGNKKLERLNRAREAAKLIEAFRAEKLKRGLYGYTDVLRIVVDALSTDESLRADLQEQYQYVLADEHQDANALQHALLDALAFDEFPNLFIVGDEKQAIFRFQGADSTHFRTFLEHYPRTQVIELTENFRSYQGILDVSHSLLADLPSSTGEHVQLQATRGKGDREGGDSGGVKTALLVAPDPLAERDQIAQMVETAIAEGVPPHEIAIITLRNATADLFATHLRAKGVPALRAGDVDLEGRPSVRALLMLLYAVADASNTAALREALLAPWWKMPLADRAHFLRRWRNYELIDALATTFPEVSHIITNLQKDALALPPLPLLSKILSSSGARAYFLGTPDGLEDIKLVRQIVMYVEEMVARDPNTTLAAVMDEFGKAREHGLGSVKTNVTQMNGYVTVITAHKAKGMEFERVFVASLTKSEWEGGRSGLIPSPFDTKRDMEDVTRLLYVAMTRAKDELVLSYPEGSGDGKEITPTRLLPSGLEHIEAKSEALPLFHSVSDAPALVRELTCAYLEHEGLSPSAFNEYLESPACFFAKRVLRLSEPETPAITIGVAVHAGVAGYLRKQMEAAKSPVNEEEKVEAARAELARCLARSLLPRNAAFDDLTRHARASLDSYLSDSNNAVLSREPVAVEETFSTSRKIRTQSVLLKGKVDAVFKENGGECIVDFKTASTIGSDKKKFERQLAFYDLVLRENGHATTSAKIIQVNEDSVKEHDVALTDDTRADLVRELDEVLKEMIEGKWRSPEPGATTDYDALLELFK